MRHFPGFVPVVLGDGELPILLTSCLQFRLVADLLLTDRAEPAHVLQLRRHIEPGRCRRCRSHVATRLQEAGVRLAI